MPRSDALIATAPSRADVLRTRPQMAVGVPGASHNAIERQDREEAQRAFERALGLKPKVHEPCR
jgi:hypothetical protein